MRWNRDARRRSIRLRLAPGSAVVSVTLVAALVAGGVTTVAAASVAASPWSVTPSPSPFRPIASPLSAVSCSSTTSCFAVGTRSDLDDFDYPGVPHTVQGPTLVIERWDGTTWSPVAVPVAGDPGADKLHGVACVSAMSCVAVGALGTSVNTNTLAEAWDGTSWSVVASPSPMGATSSRLDAVSCSDATNCYAVGSSSSDTVTTTLIERWDGTSWTIVPTPDPTAAVSASLSGVSCASATNCFAVGAHVEVGDNMGGALVEHWDGTSWTIVATPTPTVRPVDAPAFPPRLTAVSCSTETSCFAVGYTASDALIEQWNGTSWSLLASPVPHVHLGVAALHGVSCASAFDCSAVGVTFDTSLARKGTAVPNSIAERWDGTAWTILARPTGVPTNKGLIGQLNSLSGVSCPSATSCFAVGSSALPERWDGSRWSLAPLAAPTSSSYLNQVTCPTPTSCFAVGTAVSPLDDSNTTLVERWDGTAWSIVPSPTPSGLNVHAALSSISCPSPTDCTAVGTYDASSVLDPNGGSVRALIEHWNGTRWSIVANPKPTKVASSGLSGVSCTSATNCNAVGGYAKNGTDLPLLEHWDGVRWAIVAVPSLDHAALSAVSCSSAASCFAVGGYVTSAGPHTLAERWDGKSWSIVPTPNSKARTFFQLNALSCRTATDCTAVGLTYINGSTSAERTLIEHWNGKSWSIKASPSPIGPNGFGVTLSGVSCSSATSCIAVGSYDGSGPSSSTGNPLIEQWNGAAWSVVPIPTPPDSTGGFIGGVTCSRATTCVAVGGRFAHDGLSTLVERRA